MSHVTRLIALAVWIGGIVVAKGFLMTFFAVIFPPLGWYLLIERLLMHFSVI